MKLTCDYCGASFEIKEHPICPICGASYEHDEQYKRHLVRAAKEQEIKLRKQEQEMKFQEAATARMNEAIAKEKYNGQTVNNSTVGRTPAIRVPDRSLKHIFKALAVPLAIIFAMPVMSAIIAIVGLIGSVIHSIAPSNDTPSTEYNSTSGYTEEYDYEDVIIPTSSPTPIPIVAQQVTGGFLDTVSDGVIVATMKSACISHPYYSSELSRLQMSNKAVFCFEFDVENLQKEVYRFDASDANVTSDGYALERFILNEYHGHTTPHTVSLYQGDKKLAWICVEAPIDTKHFKVKLTDTITFAFDNFISTEEIIKFYEESSYE